MQQWIAEPTTRQAFHAGLEHALLHGLAAAEDIPAWENWCDWLGK